MNRDERQERVDALRAELYLPAHEHPDREECVGCALLRRLSGTTFRLDEPDDSTALER